MTEFDTVRMPEFKKTGKLELVKVLTPVFLAIIAIVGSIVTAFLQFDTSDKVDSKTKVSEQKIEFLVEQINGTMLPMMQISIKELVTQNNELRERIVRLETKLDIAAERSLVRRMYDAAITKKAPKKVQSKIPKLRMKR